MYMYVNECYGTCVNNRVLCYSEGPDRDPIEPKDLRSGVNEWRDILLLPTSIQLSIQPAVTSEWCVYATCDKLQDSYRWRRLLGTSQCLGTANLHIAWGAEAVNIWEDRRDGDQEAKLYCNIILSVPEHTSTEERPSFLPFGIDCHSPMEAVLLPMSALNVPTEVQIAVTNLCSPCHLPPANVPITLEKFAATEVTDGVEIVVPADKCGSGAWRWPQIEVLP